MGTERKYRPFSPIFPVCFESAAQFHEWKRAADTGQLGITVHGYCSDCTPEYQGRMKAEQRCAYPEVKFVVDHDNGLHGVRGPKGRPPKKFNGE